MLEEYNKDFNLDIRRRYAQDNERILCHVSNFRKVKRVEDVVKTFKLVNEKIPSRLLLVGDGPERFNVEKLCRELGTCDRVITVGKVRDTSHVVGLADLFLLPSQTESFGLAALEAMAANVPVVSSNTGGIPEVNEHGFSGYLADVGDVEAMAKYSIEILQDDEVLKTFKANAMAQAEKFALNAILPKYEELYEQVIRDHKKQLTK